MRAITSRKGVVAIELGFVREDAVLLRELVNNAIGLLQQADRTPHNGELIVFASNLHDTLELLHIRAGNEDVVA